MLKVTNIMELIKAGMKGESHDAMCHVLEQVEKDSLSAVEYVAKADDGNEGMTLPFDYPREMYPKGWTDFSVPPIYICGDDVIKEVVTCDSKTRVCKREIKRLSKSTVNTVYGKGFVGNLRFYEGFSNEPGYGADYRWTTSTVGGNKVNLFNPTGYELYEGEFPHIDRLLAQVFGRENMTRAYDYFSLAWQKPNQMLPVLVLISRENGTGKSTFLHFIERFSSGNAVILGEDALDNQFNSYITKAFVMVDEMRNGRRHMSKIKQLATASSMELNLKGIQQQSVHTFAKLILAGNDVDKIIAADKYDQRYWVRELQEIPQTEWVADFDDRLREEIPAFAQFISTRKIETPKTSRMWFSHEDLKTAALENIVRHSRSRCLKDIMDFANRYAEERDVDSIQATVKDIQQYFRQVNIKHCDRDILKALREELGLRNRENATTYTKYSGDEGKGKFYDIPAEQENCNENTQAEIMDEEEMPF